MDKISDSVNNYNHVLNVNDRKNIYITGVVKIDSFDDEEFLIETTMGYMALKGENLEITRLDTKDGIVSIKGMLISLSYIEDLKTKNKEGNVFSKLFK